MKKNIVAVASLCMTCAIPTVSMAESSAYVGAGYGQYKFKFEDNRNNQDFSDKNDLGKIFLGVQANEVIGAELTYLAFSEGEDQFIESDIEGVSAALTVGIPLSDAFAIRARGGWLIWEADYATSGLPLQVSRTVDGEDFFAGVGLELGLAEPLAIRIDYDRYELDEDIDPELDIVSVSAQLSF